MALFIIFILFFSCGENPSEDVYLPDPLPSEETIKENLSNDKTLAKLDAKAQSLGKTIAEWKEEEKKLVAEKEINLYWQKEKKSIQAHIADTDSIDRQRTLIRNRIVWARIFQKAKIPLRQKPKSFVDSHFLKKLNLQNSPKFGSTNAKWIIVEWSDYLCTFCRQSFPHTKNILSKYKTKVFYIHKDYPLDGDSPEGLYSLAVGRCMWEKDSINYLYHMELLYSHSKEIYRGEDLFVSAWDSLTECYPKNLDKKYISQVRADRKEAEAFGVNSVPTYWINGRWIVGSLNAESWERVLKDTADP